MPSASHYEIESRIQRGYLDRLNLRIKKMRKHLAQRNWNLLRIECIHLKNTAPSFGLPKLGVLAEKVEKSLNEAVSTATSAPATRQAAEELFATIDLLFENNS